jgi:hypothetical protein
MANRHPNLWLILLICEAIVALIVVSGYLPMVKAPFGH